MKFDFSMDIKAVFRKRWSELQAGVCTSLRCNFEKAPRHSFGRDRPYFGLFEDQKSSAPPHLRGNSQTAGSEQDV